MTVTEVIKGIFDCYMPIYQSWNYAFLKITFRKKNSKERLFNPYWFITDHGFITMR